VSKALSQLSPDLEAPHQYRVPLKEPSLEFRIDNILLRPSDMRILAVVDAKYKDPIDLDTADVQQVLAYATATGARHAFLVYPTSAGATSISVGDIRLTVLSLDISRDVVDAAADLCADVRNALAESGQARSVTTQRTA
jgi:hypothetical protein